MNTENTETTEKTYEEQWAEGEDAKTVAPETAEIVTAAADATKAAADEYADAHKELDAAK